MYGPSLALLLFPEAQDIGEGPSKGHGNWQATKDLCCLPWETSIPRLPLGGLVRGGCPFTHLLCTGPRDSSLQSPPPGKKSPRTTSTSSCGCSKQHVLRCGLVFLAKKLSASVIKPSRPSSKEQPTPKPRISRWPTRKPEGFSRVDSHAKNVASIQSSQSSWVCATEMGERDLGFFKKKEKEQNKK